MDDLSLNRLYLLYKSGTKSTAFPEETDLLLVARAVDGDELSEDEFRWLATQIAELKEYRDERTTQAMAFHQGMEAIDSYRVKAMANQEYQERLWELPDQVRAHEKPFFPTRLADGNPIDIDKNDPEKTQETIRALPYHQVKHDAKLRDAWHAAQKGKLASLLKNGDVWQAFTDSKAMGEALGGAKIDRQSVSFPLRQMLSLVDAGVHQSALSPNRMDESKSLPTWRVYQYDPKTVVRRLMDDDKNFEKTWRDHHIYETGLDKIPTQTHIADVLNHDEHAVKSWVAEIREHHEMQVRQMMVDRQLEDYRPGAAKESKPIDTNAVMKDFAQDAAAKVVENPGIVEKLVPEADGGMTDKLQTLLDGIGVADPTPIADGVNAGISLVRAIADPQNAGSHLVNAATSAVSMIPYVGDLAKAAKYGGKAAKSADIASAAGKAASNAGPEIASVASSAANVASSAAASGGSGGSSGWIASLLGAFGGSGGGSGASVATAAGAGGAGAAGGSAGAAGGLAGMAGPIGLAIAAVVADTLHRFNAAKKFVEPEKYTGDSFDSAKAMTGRGMDAFNAIAPIDVKWGPFGWMLSAATKALEKWVDWLKRVEDSGNQIIEANRNLANYSGTIASAFAELDADRVRREMAKASSMGGQLKDLAKNQSDFEAAKQDLFEPFERLQILIQSKITWFATQTIRLVDRMEAISEMIDYWLGKDKVEGERSALEASINAQEIDLKDKL